MTPITMGLYPPVLAPAIPTSTSTSSSSSGTPNPAFLAPIPSFSTFRPDTASDLWSREAKEQRDEERMEYEKSFWNKKHKVLPPKDEGDGEKEKDGEKSDDDGGEISAAQAFHDAIKEKAELGEVSGNMIITFDEVLVTTPRGRYDIDMFPEFLRLRGKTYDYKILYTTIARLFLLPKDDMHVLFIVSSVFNLTAVFQTQTFYS